MRKLSKSVIIAVILVFSTVILASCVEKVLIINIKEYPAAGTSFVYDIHDNLNISGMDAELLKNPDRGFRGEIYITLGTDRSYPGNDISPEQCLENQLAQYRAQGDEPMIMQTYVYLTEFYNKKINDSALNQLKSYFELLRSKNLRILLRFAYEYNNEVFPYGPTTGIIERHARQLKNFFRNNLTLFYETVYAMQLGMIGLWGEGHGNINELDVERVTKAVAEMVPDGIAIMARNPSILTLVPDEYEYKYGVHDDFLIGYEHPWGMMPFTHPQYQNLLNKSKYTPSDGEMPWGSDTTIPLIDPYLMLKQALNYGLTTMSYAHNYVEDGNEYYLAQWKEHYICLAESEDTDVSFTFEVLGLPYNPRMLDNFGGLKMISVYDYLNYHLGYQLAVSNFKVNGGKASFMVTNFGMSAPHNFAMELIVGDNVIKVEDFSPYDLMQFGQKVFEFDYNGTDSIGVRFIHNKDNRLTIKLANDIDYINGINYIKK